nr:unnamed protein product [Callosobruchus analis]
MFKVSYFN